MADTSNNSKMGQWLVFVGILILALGIYSGARAIINFVAFEKYPTSGVGMDLFRGFPSSSEEDCFYPQIYTLPDGKGREPTEQEKEIERINQERCVRSIQQQRKEAKIYDTTKSAFLILIGLGLIKSRKFIS